jgi:hypothetical protein
MTRRHTILERALVLAGALIALSACTQVSSDPRPEEEAPSLIESVLPEGAEIVGTCQRRVPPIACELYFNSGVEAWTEQEGYEECRGVDTEDTWSDDFWHSGESCPEDESLRSVCVYRHWAQFQYEGYWRGIDESRHGCEIDGGTFIVFDEGL